MNVGVELVSTRGGDKLRPYAVRNYIIGGGRV